MYLNFPGRLQLTFSEILSKLKGYIYLSWMAGDIKPKAAGIMPYIGDGYGVGENIGSPHLSKYSCSSIL